MNLYTHAYTRAEHQYVRVVVKYLNLCLPGYHSFLNMPKVDNERVKINSCDSFVSTTRWILVPNNLERVNNATTRNVAPKDDHAQQATVLVRPGRAVYSRLHQEHGTYIALVETTTTNLGDSSTSSSFSSSTRTSSHGNGTMARHSAEHPTLSEPKLARVVAWKDKGNLTETTLLPVHKLIPLYASAAAAVAAYTPLIHSTMEAPSIPILVTERTDVYRLLAGSQLFNPTATATSPVLVVVPTNSEVTIAINDAAATASANGSATAVVLEIGTSTGGTSEIVWQQAAHVSHWMGLDTSLSMVQTVQTKLDHFVATNSFNAKQRYACRHLDPLMDPDTAALLVRSHFDTTTPTTHGTKSRLLTVLVDIGGNREEGAVIRMIQWVLQSFAAAPSARLDGSRVAPLVLHQIIVKSETVYAAAQEQVHQGANQKSLHAWYQSRWLVARQASVPRHALQAPKRLVPTMTLKNGSSGRADDNGSTPICRYHNYDQRWGCVKRQCPVDPCPYNHNHCHWCRAVGHVAYNCPQLDRPSTVQPTRDTHHADT
jgi:hypothetical protein